MMVNERDLLTEHPHLVTATELVENKVYRLIKGNTMTVFSSDNEHLLNHQILYELQEGDEFLVLAKATRPNRGALFRTKLIGVTQPFFGYLYSANYELFEELIESNEY